MNKGSGVKEAVTNISDHVLMQRIAAKDVDAFSILVKRHTSYALTIACRIVSNREDAEEVVQDCFLKISRDPGKFEGNSKFSTWFYRVVSNAALSKIRKKSLDQESIDNSHFNIGSDSDQSRILEKEDQKKILKAALLRLSEDERELISLYYLNEYTQDELAEAFKIDKGALKVKLFRIRKKLSSILKHIKAQEVYV